MIRKNQLMTLSVDLLNYLFENSDVESVRFNMDLNYVAQSSDSANFYITITRKEFETFKFSDEFKKIVKG